MVHSPVTRWSCLACGLAAVIWLPACGGSSSNSVPPPQISVGVHPKGTSVVAGSQQQQFSATVMGDPRNLGVTWAVDGLAWEWLISQESQPTITIWRGMA